VLAAWLLAFRETLAEETTNDRANLAAGGFAESLLGTAAISAGSVAILFVIASVFHWWIGPE